MPKPLLTWTTRPPWLYGICSPGAGEIPGEPGDVPAPGTVDLYTRRDNKLFYLQVKLPTDDAPQYKCVLHNVSIIKTLGQIELEADAESYVEICTSWAEGLILTPVELLVDLSHG